MSNNNCNTSVRRKPIYSLHYYLQLASTKQFVYTTKHLNEIAMERNEKIKQSLEITKINYVSNAI